ncbi:hypothetical protein ACKLNQ_12750 [Myroides odoratimimus]|uniref:hypothetical protein n=1 Tax=Myroides odoratimimus TaxID=76832 RepID=UPI0038D49ADF
MVKYYKKDLLGNIVYKESWVEVDQQYCIIHWGKYGYQGKTKQMFLSEYASEQEYFKIFANECEEEGYSLIPTEEMYQVVIQFPLASTFGNKRDKWLQEKVEEYLNEYLGWRGVGHVDGFDIGGFKLNIFCKVVEPTKAVSCIKTCLKTSHLDLTRCCIASRKQNEEEYLIHYSLKKVTKFQL